MKNFIIPGEIELGYQERNDTYTKRLGFITYVDDLGKMKFEKSWKGWCSDVIPKDKFENVPTTGFVLNKNGGGSWGRFERAEFVRIYDPRGFEFEISIDNLMKIILHNGITKGNGIEGELVYAWEAGKRKVSLVPVTCEEYESHIQKQAQFKDMVKLESVKEIVPGFEYKTKTNNIYTYLGHLECYYYGYSRIDREKRHIFYNAETNEFRHHKTRSLFTHKLGKVDMDPIMENFSTSIFNTAPTKEFKKMDFKEYYAYHMLQAQ